MPGQYNIKWRPIDEKLLQRSVRNYNAKRRRLINIDPSIEEYLPSSASIRDIRRNITSRRDFNNAINRLQRFSRRGSEKLIERQGTVLTEYEYKELQYSIRRLNARRKKERINLNSQLLKTRGESTDYTVGMADIEVRSLRSRQLNIRNKSRKELEKYFDILDTLGTDKYAEQRAELYRSNYLKAFMREFNGMPYFDEFYKQLENLPKEAFINILRTDTEGGIDFIYDDFERVARYTAIAGVWSEFINTENIINNL